MAQHFLFFTQAHKRVAGHIYLPAHLQKFRRIGQRFGNIMNGGQVSGDIFPHKAVPPRRAAYKRAIFIFQADGQAVDFGLYHILRPYAFIAHTPVKFAHFIQRKHVLKAFHLHRMLHFFKPAGGRAPHMLRERRLGDEFRVLGLYLFQPPCKGVKFEIIQLRRVEVVIQMAVIINFFF